jgi:hypothetical protein
MELEGLIAPYLLIKLEMAIDNSTPLITKSPLSKIPPISLSSSKLGTIPLNISNLTLDSSTINN